MQLIVLLLYVVIPALRGSVRTECLLGDAGLTTEDKKQLKGYDRENVKLTD
jgi:hypothetical protein